MEGVIHDKTEIFKVKVIFCSLTSNAVFRVSAFGTVSLGYPKPGWIRGHRSVENPLPAAGSCCSWSLSPWRWLVPAFVAQGVLKTWTIIKILNSKLFLMAQLTWRSPQTEENPLPPLVAADQHLRGVWQGLAIVAKMSWKHEDFKV